MQAEQQIERKRFEAWLENDYMSGLDGPGEWDAERNCYVQLPVHMAWCAFRAALSHPSAQGWQPIETCPMDTMVIFGPTKRMTGPCIGMRHSRDGWVTETPYDWASIYPPKEWMPLDLPPPEQGGKG